jgi:hypothetical protein
MNNLSHEFIAKITEFANNQKSNLSNEKKAQLSAKKALSDMHEKYSEIIDASEEIINFKEIKVLNAEVLQTTETRRYGTFTRPRIESKAEKEMVSDSLMDIWDYNIVATSPGSFLILPSLKIVKCNECRGSGNHQSCNGSASIDCSACRGRGTTNCKGKECVNGKCAKCAGKGDRQCVGCRGSGSIIARGGKQTCTGCRGGGRMRCLTCMGSGACRTCKGHGVEPCTSCQGIGRKECSCRNGKCLKCEGYGELENYDTLNVHFSVNKYNFRNIDLHDSIKKASYDKFDANGSLKFIEFDVEDLSILHGSKYLVEAKNSEEYLHLKNQLLIYNIKLSTLDFNPANNEKTKCASCSLNDLVVYSFYLLEDKSPIFFINDEDNPLFIPSNHKLLAEYNEKILKELELLKLRQQIEKEEKLEKDKLKAIEEERSQKLKQFEKQKMEKASFDKELDFILATGDIDKAIKKTIVLFNMDEVTAKRYLFKFGNENGYKDIITLYEKEQKSNFIRGALFLSGLCLGWYFYKWWVGIILGFILSIVINAIIQFLDKNKS